MSMVHVLAVITAKPGKRAEVLANFNANVPAVHAEAVSYTHLTLPTNREV